MRHLQVIGVGFLTTVIAIALLSFVFPKRWQVEDSIRIEASDDIVSSLVADANAHTLWNPPFVDAQIVSADRDQLTIALNDGSNTLLLSIVERAERRTVKALTSVSGRAEVAHEWEMVRDGSGTIVSWKARSTQARHFVFRFANVPIKAWMTDEIDRALTSLKMVSERQQVSAR